MKTFVVLSALMALAAASPLYKVSVTEDTLGAYRFEYEGDDAYRKEVRAHNGDTVGSYKFVSPEGKTYVVDFVSGANQGVTATGAHLPVAAQNPDVLKAAKEHLAVWEATAKANGIFEENKPTKKTVLVPVVHYVPA